MSPGRELDALVAEKVVGLEVVRNLKGGWSIGPADWYDVHGESILSNPLPSYSEDISAAWEVLKHFKERYGGNTVVQINGDCDYGWRVELGEVRYPEPSRTGIAFSESLPEAICLAALKAVGVDVDQST